MTSIGLRREDYGTHSLRRTNAAIIYKQTGNLRGVQILLGHPKIESTVRYLGVDIEDALIRPGERVHRDMTAVRVSPGDAFRYDHWRSRPGRLLSA